MDSKRVARRTRWYRKLHWVITSFSFIFFLFNAISGLLLGWKKHSGGYLLAKTYTGTTTDLREWLPWTVFKKRQ